MNFEQEFEAWLSNNITCEIPEDVKAFSFNLFESCIEDDKKFGIELIGAGEFDSENEDWACDEIWEPKLRELDIPTSFSGESWEICQERLKSLITKVLASNTHCKNQLKSRKGIGIGFVDGNLEMIWQSMQTSNDNR